MSYLKLGELDDVLSVQKTELNLLAIIQQVIRLNTAFGGTKTTHMTFGAWCETMSFMVPQGQ